MSDAARRRSRPTSPATRARRGLLPPQLTITVSVPATAVSEQDLLNVVQGALLRHASSNWRSGLTLPGRMA
jgi:hypothetical protein